MSATNRPQELDDAALRRFPKRILVAMPDPSTRARLLSQLLRQNRHNLTEAQLTRVAHQTDGYSGSDLTNLAKDAAMGPVRDLHVGEGGGGGGRGGNVRPIDFRDFEQALKKVKKSVAAESVKVYEDWNAEFGDTE